MSGRAARDRQKQFKKGIDTDQARRNREETTVQLRKSKREDSLQKRRKDIEVSGGAQPTPFDPASTAVAAAAGIADLPQLIAAVSSEDRTQQREATVRFRKLLSIGEESVPRVCFYPTPTDEHDPESALIPSFGRAQPSHPRSDQFRSRSTLRPIPSLCG